MLGSKAKRIEAWFGKKQAVSLILPSGSFGRPSDNQHKLTYTLHRSSKTVVELDHQLWLVFTNLRTIRDSGNRLVLTGFDQCVFDWQEYVSMTAHADVFNEGEITFEST
jgi:hypothetical protein